MRRPQFTLKTLLWLMAVVAAFLGGRAYQKRIDEPFWIYKATPPDQLEPPKYSVEIIRLGDGSQWQRTIYDGSPIPPVKPNQQAPTISSPSCALSQFPAAAGANKVAAPGALSPRRGLSCALATD